MEILDRITESIGLGCAGFLETGDEQMTFFKGSNRVVKSFLVVLVVFSGVFASPALADDTVSVDVSLESWRTYDPNAGFSITIGDDFTLEAINDSGGSMSGSIAVMESCLLEKGQSYDLEVLGHGLHYSGADGYLASMTTSGIVLKDDYAAVADHSSDNYGDYESPTPVGEATIHVPKIDYKRYEFNPGSGGGAGISYGKVFMNCEPNVTECIEGVDIEWFAVANNGAEVSVEKDGTLKGRFPISETNTPVYVRATYGGEMLYQKFCAYDGTVTDVTKVEQILLVLKYLELKASKEPIDTKTGNNYFTEKRLSAPAPGVPLVLDLSYKSVTDQPVGRLGKGWRHSYEWVLNTYDSTNFPAILYTGEGSKQIFERTDGSTYISPMGSGWQLEADGNEHALELPGGRVYRFNTNGFLSSVSDAWGNGVACSYGTNDCLETVTHSNGRQLVFSNRWDVAASNWCVASIQMEDGAALDFSYNTDGQFTQIVEHVDSDDFVSSYQYADGFLTNKVNGMGTEFQYGYEADTNGMLTGKGTFLKVDEFYEHELDYADDETTHVTYALRGQNQVYHYDYDGSLLRNTYGPATTISNALRRGISYTYSADGSDKIKEVLFDEDEPARWMEWMDYDAAHNVTNLSVAYGTTNPVHQLSLEYDSDLNLPTAVVEPDGSRTETTYTNGLPLTVKAFLSDTQSHDTHYSYTTNGWLRAVTNANGHATAYSYDASGNLSTITPEVGPVVTNTYDALGFLKTTEFHVVESQFLFRRITEFDRDAKGRVTQTIFADGLTSSAAYNALGYLTNSIDRAGRATDYTYAPTKQLTSVTQYLEQGGSNVPVCISYDLDEQMNQLKITEPRGRYVETYQLDIQDRVTSVTNIESQVMSIDYGIGSFVQQTTRFDGTTITNTFDTAGRLAVTTYRTAGGSPAAIIGHTYYPDSEQKSISDATSTNSYGYNPLNRLTSATNIIASLTSVADYQYDPVGNVTNTSVSVGGAEAVSSSYTYDAAERLYSISRPVPGSTTNSVFVYTYNPRNGAVASVQNTNIGITCFYGYDIMERIDSIRYTKSGGGLIRSVDYDYDATGMITNKTIIGGVDDLTLGYGYDSINRLTSETRHAAGSASATTEYDYDLAGNRRTKTANDNSVTYTLGSGNRLASWSASFTNNLMADVRGTSSETIGTDDRWGELWVSNLTAQAGVKPQADGTSFLANNVTMQMGTNEFVAAVRDEAGNMGYATNTVVYSVVTNATFLYNAAGCITNIAHTGSASYSDNLALDWDERYRLTGADDGTSEIGYGYDVQGRKVSRTVGGTTEYYMYDGNQIVADVNASGNILRSYVWGVGIDNLLSFTDHTTTNIYYPIKDHQNTILALANESGDIVETYDYDAYGRTKVFSATGTQLTASAYGNRYTFQGREVDWATGLIYFRARWYNPVVGRWLSKDPIGIAGGLNLYAFCGNNPVMFVDPDGRKEDPNQKNYNYVVNPNPDAGDCSEYACGTPGATPTDIGYSQLKNNDSNQKGDLVSWHNDQGKITHVGIVTKVDSNGNTIEVTSVWGGGGPEVKHNPNNKWTNKKYGENRKYWREKEE